MLKVVVNINLKLLHQISFRIIKRVGCILLPVNSCDLVIHYMAQLEVMLKGKGYAKIFKNVILPFLFIC